MKQERKPLDPSTIDDLNMLRRLPGFTKRRIAAKAGFVVNTLENALRGEHLSPDTKAAFEGVVENYRSQIMLLRHLGDWTRVFLPDKLCDNEGLAKLISADAQGALWTRDMRASEFRQSLRVALGTGCTKPPDQAIFVSQTGQWLKPILRKLLAHPVRVRVYICHPGKTLGKETAQIISILEFLWNMAAAIGLSAKWDSELAVCTYDERAGLAQRIAAFPDKLIATSQPSLHVQGSHLRNHPAHCPGSPGVLGPQPVDVHLSGHTDFLKRMSDATKTVGALQDVQPCLRWSRSGFEIEPGFEMDPSPYLSKASASTPAPVPQSVTVNGAQSGARSGAHG
ncbi:MAG: hypothetical protein ACKVS8_10960 [Phycisphaerales bacterium]